MILFLGALACLGADTCATEIGIRFGGTPRALIGGRTLRAGESGGVTGPGLAASVGGAFLAPLSALACCERHLFSSLHICNIVQHCPETSIGDGNPGRLRK